MESIKTFIQKLSWLESSKSPQEKFRDFCELAYCAYAKPIASEGEKDILEGTVAKISMNGFS